MFMQMFEDVKVCSCKLMNEDVLVCSCKWMKMLRHVHANEWRC